MEKTAKKTHGFNKKEAKTEYYKNNTRKKKGVFRVVLSKWNFFDKIPTNLVDI